MPSIEYDKPNPFSILRIPTDATNAAIVAKAEELYVTAETDEQRQLYRWAKEQLLTDKDTRLLYELFEIPDTQYENDALESFARTHKKLPITFETQLERSVSSHLQHVDVSSLIQALLQELLNSSENRYY